MSAWLYLFSDFLVYGLRFKEQGLERLERSEEVVIKLPALLPSPKLATPTTAGHLFLRHQVPPSE